MNHEQMMIVLEGSCPDCVVGVFPSKHAGLDIIAYGGTLEWLETQMTRVTEFINNLAQQDSPQWYPGFFQEISNTLGRMSTVNGPDGEKYIFDVPDGVDVTVWRDDAPDDIGLVMSECPRCKSVYESYLSVYGDWNVAVGVKRKGG